MLKHGILGLLNYHDMTGYEIMAVFRDSLNYFWNARTSQIYRELKGLEEKGWARSIVVPQTGKPDKNVFSITEEGRRELLRWLSDGDTGLSARAPVLMKVFFLGERSREENLAFFRKIKEMCEAFLAGLSAVPEHIQAYSGFLEEKEKAAYWEMTVDFGGRNLQMHIDWAQACIDRLEGME